MSQTLTAGSHSGSTQQTREIQSITAPLTILGTPEAQAISYAQPLILASYFYLRFSALVADPVSTLLFDLAPVAIVQAAYAVICLPVSKRSTPESQVKSTTPSKTKSTKRTSKAAQNEVDLGTRISNSLLSLLLAAIATCPIYILFVLFGAPLTTHHTQTLLCAAHFSLLGVFPLFYTHGVDRRTWWEIGGAMLPFDSVWGTSMGCILGAWLGAVPIPLDWDREWQKWPVTIMAGMYIGAFVGNLAGRHMLHGKRLRFMPAIEEHKTDLKKTS